MMMQLASKENQQQWEDLCDLQLVNDWVAHRCVIQLDAKWLERSSGEPKSRDVGRRSFSSGAVYRHWSDSFIPIGSSVGL